MPGGGVTRTITTGGPNIRTAPGTTTTVTSGRTIKTGGKGAWGMPVSGGTKRIATGGATAGGSTTTTTFKRGGGTTWSKGGSIGFGGGSSSGGSASGGSSSTSTTRTVAVDPREALKGKRGSGYRGR